MSQSNAEAIGKTFDDISDVKPFLFFTCRSAGKESAKFAHLKNTGHHFEDKGVDTIDKETSWFEREFLIDGTSGTKNMIYSLTGAFLCVALALLAIVAMTRRKNKQKSRRPSETLNQMNDRYNDGRINMHPVGNSSHSHSHGHSMPDNVDSLHAISSDAGAVGYSFRYNPDNVSGHVTIHQEDSYHICQDNAEVEMGRFQIPDVEQIAPCTLPIQSSVQSTISTSQTSMPSSECCGLHETSLGQPAGGCEDEDYQDVDFCRIDRISKDDVRSPCETHLFDDSCYKSLNFGNRPDDVCTRRQNAGPSNTHIHEAEVVDASEIDRTMTGLNEYVEFSDSTGHTPHDYIAQSYNPELSASGSKSKRKVYSNKGNTTSCTSMGFLLTEPSGDVFYQLEREERNKVDTSNESQFSEAFDSEEYSVLNPQNATNDVSISTTRESDFHGRHDAANSESKNCDGLYAKVDKTVGASSTPPPLCEELYATVNKTRGTCGGDSKPAWQEELYMNV
ncbi:uncharacterized protein [Diadema setosum]|uniref:uncharacterized protein n=1 Tax=Diadema setosum TaxID=31175 RepID=UPI003B3A7C89